MTKTDGYREILHQVDDWDDYLMRESGLPGPRGNIELAQAAALEGDEARFNTWLSYTAALAPTNSPREFLAFCGVLGLGEMLAKGRFEIFERLRQHASDPRWRTREAVAMALQKMGRRDMNALILEMKHWSSGNPLEKRAVAAALCEPDLLLERHHARQVLDILNEITASIQEIEDRKEENFRALRKGLGYCWSVAVAAHPEMGKPLMEGWMVSSDPDIRWIMHQNLQKNRLRRMDATWVTDCLSHLEDR